MRRGLVGKIDLEQYDYSADSRSLVRPTEGTVESRLPPRMRVREQAPLESPHIMVLVDDALHTVIEPLQKQKNAMEPLYDFDLMADGGHIAGWRVAGDLCAQVDAAMLFLLSGQQCCRGVCRECAPPMLIAVGMEIIRLPRQRPVGEDQARAFRTGTACASGALRPGGAGQPA